MDYQALVERIAETTGSDADTVRAILGAFPGVVMEGDVGEKTRTPLGVFTLTQRKQSKPVKTPTGHWGSAQPMVLARLKPGTKLRRDSSNEPSGLSSEMEEDPNL